MQRVDANMQSSQEGDSWHGCDGQSVGELWTWCPVDVEEDGGEGEMVRGQEPVWRRTSQGSRSMRCPAGLRVPCACTYALCASLGGSVRWVPRDAFTPAAGPPGIHLPRLDSTGPCQGPGGHRLADKQERSNVRSRSRGRVSGCQCSAGAVSLPSASSSAQWHPQYAHKPTHTHRSLWACRWCKLLPKSAKRARIGKHITKRVSSS